jgi:hypothetical protein
MTRGQGWRFLDMGRKLERSLHTIALVRLTLGTAQGAEGPLLEALLEIADSSMTYRRRYLGSLRTAAVLDLLLADETNPRSLAFQMAALADDVEHLPRETEHPGRGPEQRLMLSALTSLRLADVERLAQPDRTAPGRTWKNCSAGSPPTCRRCPSRSRDTTSVICKRRGTWARARRDYRMTTRRRMRTPSPCRCARTSFI